MPLWTIYHSTGIFSDSASKKALCSDISQIYTDAGLPLSYVVVHFIQLSASDMWVGGEQRQSRPFVRITVDHIAVRLPDEDKVYRDVTARIDVALKPHVADKGCDWEYHVDETDRRLWKVNGLVAPPFGSDEEKMWVRVNRPVPWDSKL